MMLMLITSAWNIPGNRNDESTDDIPAARARKFRPKKPWGGNHLPLGVRLSELAE
jgi:hypothetical protein